MSLPFLDVSKILDEGIPHSRGTWFWYVGGILLLMSMLISLVGSQLNVNPQVMGLVSMVLCLVMVGTLGAITWHAARSAQQEQMQLEAIEELIQLRRWPEAGMALEAMLSRPTRIPQARTQGLIYLAAVLARYHRFADAIAVYDHVLEGDPLDEESEYGLRMGRAMSLLHEDRLFDADRAISDLRRRAGASESAGLALLEIYRDVKTGHPREAIELFKTRTDIMRRQLGHRFGDACALVARAHDLLGEEQEAGLRYEEATLLCPEVELQRRYPEVAGLSGRYPAAAVPAEVA